MSITPKNWNSFQHYKDRAPSWIKLHKGLLNDFAFTRLPIASKALAPLLWLLASEYDGGTITCSNEEIAFRLRWTEEDFEMAIKPLIESGFFVTDSAALADRKQDACLEKEKSNKEEKEKEKKALEPVAKVRPRASDDFLSFKAAFPRRDGAQPWAPAEKKFNALVKTGVEPQVMIRAAAALAREEAARGNVGTKFIPQAITWLNQSRFADYAAASFVPDAPQKGFYAAYDSPQLDAWDRHERATKGKSLPRDHKGGWRVDSEWPPGHVSSPSAPILQTMQ